MIRKCVALPVVLLLGSLTGFASQNKIGYPSQFHVRHTKKPSQTPAQARSTTKNAKSPAALAHSTKVQAKGQAQINHVQAHNASGVTTLGLVAAPQIPAGGAVYDPGLSGDFNGDGKQDVITIVENCNAGCYGYELSVVLSNGNGTFQAPVLTPIANDDPILVGDVNGDGKEDVLQFHAGSTPSTFDVWLGNGDGTFKEGNNYQVSPSSLEGGLITDSNGDGKMDVVAVDTQVPGLVRTLLGNGDGTFQPATSVTLPTQAPGDLVFADFNGDGKPDFAGFDGNNQVNVYVQEGGNFVLKGAPLTTPDSEYVDYCAIVAGDMTGDGAAEIAVVNCGGSDENTVTVYVNNGDGTFPVGVYYADASTPGAGAADMYPYAATIADVNGDGKGDIVVTGYDSGDVSVLLSNGDGTVKVPNVAFATGGYPYVPAVVADFNGDGLADIMQLDYEYSYAYLQGYGDGTFRAAVDYFTPVSAGGWTDNYAVATGDFNGDGVPDFAVVGDGETALTIFLSRGDGSLLPGVSYGEGGYFGGVAVADFNGDGKLDIVASENDADILQIFEGNGDGTFTVGSNYSSGGSCAWQVVTGDFNHDKHPDIAVTNECSPNFGVLLNDGTGNFMSAVTYPLAACSYQGWGIATGDVNGDGYLDLLIPLYYRSVVALFEGNTDNSGTFGSETDISLTNGSASYINPDYITLGDFNGDGKLDFAVSIDDQTYYNEGLAVDLGNGDGTFGTPALYSVTNQNFVNFDDPEPMYIQAGDMNGDGILDLVYNNEEFGTVGILYGNGDGSFGLPTEFPVVSDSYGVAIADINGDGALDVVAISDDSNEIGVLLNATGSAVQPDFTVVATSTTNTVPAGSPATYDLTLTGTYGYTSTVTLTCSGLPAKATCSFSPATVSTAGNLPQATVLTITTTAATTASLTLPRDGRSDQNSGSHPLLASLSGLGLFGFVLAAEGKKKNRRQMMVVLAVLLLAMTFTLVGCSGTSTSSTTTTTTIPGTPAGTYTVVVTSTGAGANAPAHSMNLTLVVQ